LTIKPREKDSLKDILYSCGTKEKRNPVCTRNLTACGEALTKSEVVQVQIPSTWKQWKEKFSSY
jgi:hypothetical protein